MSRKEVIEQRQRSLQDYVRSQNGRMQKHYEEDLKNQGVGLQTPDLLAALKSTNLSTKEAAAFLLEERGERSAIPPFRSLLKDANPMVALVAAHDLAQFDDSSGFDAVIHEAKNKSTTIRMMAVGTVLDFARFPEQKSVVLDVLEKALGDEDKLIRLTAAAGLAIIADPATIPALKSAQHKEPDATARMIIGEHVHWLEYLQSLRP
jgi:HEAT repeat protein